MSDVDETRAGEPKMGWRSLLRLALKLAGLCAYVGFLAVGVYVVCGRARAASRWPFSMAQSWVTK